MFVRNATWQKIRDEFTEQEKEALRAAERGQILCPPGVTVNPDLLDRKLAAKLATLLANTEAAERRAEGFRRSPARYFSRRIESRKAETDGTESVILQCGHMIIRVIPDPNANHMDCPECVNEFVHRAKTTKQRSLA